ncbi:MULTISPECIES: hypothetical protein [Bacillus cereus group]|uniref:hypothetical protein n=1 Tax=Bacillus cereus group TaxID=86661 RepID=UPI000BF7BF44|nr:hypothetical protein [Bacillus cereus]PES55131.1 hypothetical protein CN515_03460 [Bacillus cereus]
MKKMVLIDVNASEVAKHNRYIQLTKTGIVTTDKKEEATPFTEDKAVVFTAYNKNLKTETR